MTRRPTLTSVATLLVALPVLAGDAAGQGGQPRVAADSAVLISRLGRDTLAIEQVIRAGNRIDARVLLRTPSTSLLHYDMRLAPDGRMQSLRTVAVDPMGNAPPRQVGLLTRVGDSLRVESGSGDSVRVRMVAASADALPFIDMVHWPFELTLARLSAGTPRVTQPLLTGQRTSDFTFARLGADSATITHPTRGTMRARVDARGRLHGLDAGATTRKLIVERRPWMALGPVAAVWAAQDRAGRSFGALSERGAAKATVHGATIAVDYGTPMKRGREIWGALVPYGQVWRTGANAATGITTDRALRLGTGADTLHVPAGSYTLFSIPAADGGLLIVNEQTGQTGTAYDATRDLGRVRMTRRALPESVETFTIEVAPAGDAGELRLLWDRTAMVVPFRVLP